MGSTLNMYTILNSLGIPTEMYIDCDMGHGLDGSTGCTTPGCYPDDFGTLLTNPTDVQTYMVKRACAFFQNNINGIINTGTTKFIECPI